MGGSSSKHTKLKNELTSMTTTRNNLFSALQQCKLDLNQIKNTTHITENTRSVMGGRTRHKKRKRNTRRR